MKWSYIVLIFLLIACSSKPPKDPGSNTEAKSTPKKESQAISMEGKQLASEEESNFVTEITFPKEKSTISQSAKKELKTLSKKAKGKGKVEEIKIITWADMEYPSVHEEELSLKQQKLVNKRNDAISKYLNTLAPKTKIEKISMAERPSAIQEMFSTDDAQVKKSLETAGIPNTDTTVKVPGKASKSIVIFIMDEN